MNETIIEKLLVNGDFLFSILEELSYHIDSIREDRAGNDNNDDDIYSFGLVLRCDVAIADCDHCDGGEVD